MTQVIIPDILPLTQAIAILNQTVYSTTWTVNATSDVVVYSRPANTPANDSTQILSSSMYTVALIGDQQTVQVTLITSSLAGDIVTITRMTPADRENLYTNTNFVPSMLNNDFGILTLVDQQAQLVNQQIGPRYNYSAIIDVPIDTILPILGANQAWVMNDTRTGIIAIQPLSGDDVSGIDFIVGTANSLVPDAQALGDLTTGILKNTTISGTGTLSISPSLTSLDQQNITTDTLAYGNGTDTYNITAFTAFARSLVGAANATAAQTTLGLLIGTNVQAWNATLESLSMLGTTANRIAYTTGIDTWAETPVTTLSLALLADATQSSAAATLGVLPLAGGTMTGPIVLSGPATLGSQAVPLSQVQAMFANDQLACVVATPTDMPTWTYNNGTAGVGATLTAPTNGASTFDGVTPTNGQRIFVIFQTTNPQWQGPYTIVQGTGGTPTVLTRATDWDQASDMQAGDIFSVVNGTTYGASQWMFSQTSTITVGTTPLTFTQLAGQGALLKANNLSDLTNVTTAVANLGLTIGTNTQAFNANLQSISGLGTAADKMIYTTGVNTWAETNANAFGRSFLGLTASNGGIIYSTGSVGAVLAGTATAGQMLQSGATAAPAWSTATWPATTTINQLLYSSSNNTVVGLSTVNNGVLITSNSGVPSWLANAGTSGFVLTATVGGPPTWQAASSGNVSPGLINQVGYYAAAGSTISGLATANSGVLVTSNTGVPSISTTLPNINIGTPLSGNITAILPSGTAFNTQVGSLTTGTSTTSGTFGNIAGLSAVITPTSASNKVLVRAVLQVSSATSANAEFQLFNGTSAIGVGTSVGGRDACGAATPGSAGQNSTVSIVMEWLDNPATTSSVTYTVQYRVSAGSGAVTVNSSVSDVGAGYPRTASTITVQEIKS